MNKNTKKGPRAKQKSFMLEDFFQNKQVYNRIGRGTQTCYLSEIGNSRDAFEKLILPGRPVVPKDGDTPSTDIICSNNSNVENQFLLCLSPEHNSEQGMRQTPQIQMLMCELVVHILHLYNRVFL